MWTYQTNHLNLAKNYTICVHTFIINWKNKTRWILCFKKNNPPEVHLINGNKILEKTTFLYIILSIFSLIYEQIKYSVIWLDNQLLSPIRWHNNLTNNYPLSQRKRDFNLLIACCRFFHSLCWILPLSNITNFLDRPSI